jgi:tungstate transport system substrate-binding protein
MKIAQTTCLALTLVLGLLGGRLRADEDVLVLATTTSTENSGLLAYLHPRFERATGIRIKVVAKGTGASLQLARDGNADVVLVHARAKEDEFVRDGFGVMRRDVMYNDFVLIGPQGDPEGLADPTKALGKIASRRNVFISRGDNSGTHLREQELWKKTGVPLETSAVSMVLVGPKKMFEQSRPVGDWYLSVGQGMGKTILIATEKQAYTLADRGTYYAFALAEPKRTDLKIVSEGHPSLYNPYGVIAVNPKRHPHVNFSAAQAYIRWITSAEVQTMIGRYRVQGRVLFHPHAAESAPQAP